MNDFETGWISAFIDSEGTIALQPVHGSIRSIIVLTNTNLALLNSAEEIIGGHRYGYERQPPCSKIYYLKITNLVKIRDLLHIILPYLISKAKVAYLVHRFCDLRLQHRNAPYSQEELEIFNQVRNINRRGTNVHS